MPRSCWALSQRARSAFYAAGNTPRRKPPKPPRRRKGNAVDNAASSSAPTRVLSGRYELLEALQTGTFLAAFRARDQSAGGIVTVKIVPPAGDRPDLIALLKSGLGQTFALTHPNIVRPLDGGEDRANDAPLFLVEEYVRGIDLKERIRRAAPFQLTAATDTALAIADALQVAHSKNVFHGDVRPQNVVVGPDNQIKLSGFGIAPAQNKAVANDPEQLARIVAYAAPELSLSNAPTAAADLYALGVVLFEMLTGDVPFKGDSAVQVALKHAQNPVPSPRQVSDAVPRALDGMVQKLLAKRPEDRYADANALITDLRAVRDALKYGRSLAWSPLDSKEIASAVAALDAAATTADASAAVASAALLPVAGTTAAAVVSPALLAEPVAASATFDPYGNETGDAPPAVPAPATTKPAASRIPAPTPVAPVPVPAAPPSTPTLAPLAADEATRVMPTSPRLAPPAAAASSSAWADAPAPRRVPNPLPVAPPETPAPQAATALAIAPERLPFAPPAPGTYVLSDPIPEGDAVPAANKRASRPRSEPKEPPPVSYRASRWLTSLNIFFLLLIVGGIVLLAYQTTNFFRTQADVVVPNLVGKSFDEAKQIASANKFELATVDEQFNDKYPTDQIYQISPPAGRHIREGRSVEVWISKGPRLVTVPDVHDVSLDKARRLIEKSGLTMGGYTGEYDPLAAKGNVLRQVPEAGENRPRGSRVELVYSKGEEPAPTPYPDPTPYVEPSPEPIPDENGNIPSPAPSSDPDRTRYFDIAYNVPRDGQPHRVRIDVTDKNGPRSVYDEAKNAGEAVRFRVEGVGKPIVIKVYDNDQLTKETTQ